MFAINDSVFFNVDYIIAQVRETQSRAEQSRAEQSRAEQSRAEQSRAEQSRAEQIVNAHDYQIINMIMACSNNYKSNKIIKLNYVNRQCLPK